MNSFENFETVVLNVKEKKNFMSVNIPAELRTNPFISRIQYSIAKVTLHSAVRSQDWSPNTEINVIDSNSKKVLFSFNLKRVIDERGDLVIGQREKKSDWADLSRAWLESSEALELCVKINCDNFQPFQAKLKIHFFAAIF